MFKGMHQSARNFVEAHRGAGAMVGRIGDRFHGQDARTQVIDEGNAEPPAIEGRVMKESFDQHAGQSPSLSTGSRHAAPSRGKARSSAARNSARTAPVARLRRGGVAMPASSPNTSPMPPRYRSIMDLS